MKQSSAVKYALLAYLFLITGRNSLHAQSGKYSFTLAGTIAIDTGWIKLIPEGSPAYYPKGIKATNVKINHGKFLFSGTILYPYEFRLLSGNGKYVSDDIFIEPGRQLISCHVDSLREIPNLQNRSMREYKNDFNPQVLHIKSESASYEQKRKELSDLLFRYSRQHPGSYIALWKLMSSLRGGGYEPVLDSAFNRLSPAIRTSYTGKILQEKLITSKEVSVGSPFPILEVLDTNNRKIKIPVRSRLPKYTLIDFWFSQCPPCLGQFPDFRKINNRYKRSEFQIMSISTDFEKDIPAWKKIIHQKSLNWLQYLDVNGKIAEKFFISEFPTNFLIDQSGKIIARDIEPDQLSIFLKTNLKK